MLLMVMNHSCAACGTSMSISSMNVQMICCFPNEYIDYQFINIKCNVINNYYY